MKNKKLFIIKWVISMIIATIPTGIYVIWAINEYTIYYSIHGYAEVIGKGLAIFIFGTLLIRLIMLFPKAMEMQKKINEENAKTLNEAQRLLHATKKVGKYIEIDDVNKKWRIPDGLKGLNKIYDYSDIIDFELLEDGKSITKGGIGSAIVGGALFGGVGAIVGGVTGSKTTKDICNKLEIKITVKNIQVPTAYINFINFPVKTSNPIYQTAYNSAQECLSLLQLMCNYQEQQIQKEEINYMSSADELAKFKKLLDDGVITQAEFDKKKQQLLD